MSMGGAVGNFDDLIRSARVLTEFTASTALESTKLYSYENRIPAYKRKIFMWKSTERFDVEVARACA